MEPNERRMLLLKRHREPAEHAHERCSAEGMKLPVIFVLDLEDREGRKLAGALMAKDQHIDEDEGSRLIDAKAQEIRTKGDVIPALVMAISMEGAVAICHKMTENGERSLRQMPIDRIPVVVVSAGGNSYVGLPKTKLRN